MGAYHTLDLELNRKFSLRKECWDVVALDRLGKLVGVSSTVILLTYICLDVACDPARTADVAVVIMQEGIGLL